MKISEVVHRITEVRIPKNGYPVEGTIAREIIKTFDNRAEVRMVEDSGFVSEEGALYIAVVPRGILKRLDHQGLIFSSRDDWVSLNSDINRCLWLLGSKPHFLYTGFVHMIEELADKEVEDVLPCPSNRRLPCLV